MTTTELTRVYVPRVATPEQATACVGDMVPVREPSTFRPGTVLHDADTREPILGYLRLENPALLRRALLAIDTGGSAQTTNGRSRTFGYAPRRPIVWREACSITALGRDYPQIEQVLTHAMLDDGSDYTPYEGMKITGWPVITLVRGEIVARNGRIEARKGHGTYLKREISQFA